MSRTFEAADGVNEDRLKIAKKIFEFWEKRSCLEEHKKDILRILEQYFDMSFNYSPVYERPKAIAQLIELLRKYTRPTTIMSESLKKIRDGDVAFLFQVADKSHRSQEEERYISIFLKFMSMVDHYVPKGSRTRKFFGKLCRALYHTIS